MMPFDPYTGTLPPRRERHALMVSLFLAFYNFCRPHKALGRIHTTPAMAAKLIDRVWKLEDLVRIIDERTPAPAKPGPKPRKSSESK